MIKVNSSPRTYAPEVTVVYGLAANGRRDHLAARRDHPEAGARARGPQPRATAPRRASWWSHKGDAVAVLVAEGGLHPGRRGHGACPVIKGARARALRYGWPARPGLRGGPNGYDDNVQAAWIMARFGEWARGGRGARARRHHRRHRGSESSRVSSPPSSSGAPVGCYTARPPRPPSGSTCSTPSCSRARATGQRVGTPNSQSTSSSPTSCATGDGRWVASKKRWSAARFARATLARIVEQHMSSRLRRRPAWLRRTARTPRAAATRRPTARRRPTSLATWMAARSSDDVVALLDRCGIGVGRLVRTSEVRRLHTVDAGEAAARVATGSWQFERDADHPLGPVTMASPVSIRVGTAARWRVGTDGRARAQVRRPHPGGARDPRRGPSRGHRDGGDRAEPALTRAAAAALACAQRQRRTRDVQLALDLRVMDATGARVPTHPRGFDDGKCPLRSPSIDGVAGRGSASGRSAAARCTSRSALPELKRLGPADG